MDHIVKRYIDELVLKYKLREDEYKVFDQYIPLGKFNQVIPLGSDYGIVYDFNLIVSGITDFTKGLYQLTSPTTTIDYKELVKIDVYASSVQIHSDFISLHSSMIEMIPITPLMYPAAYTGHVRYLHFRNLK